MLHFRHKGTSRTDQQLISEAEDASRYVRVTLQYMGKLIRAVPKCMETVPKSNDTDSLQAQLSQKHRNVQYCAFRYIHFRVQKIHKLRDCQQWKGGH